MPIFVDGGNIGGSAFDAFAFGVPSQANLNFLEERLTHFSNTMTDAGQEFIKRGLEVFDRYGGSDAIRMAKAAIRTVQHAFDRDIVQPLMTIGAVQQAGSSMQRWIMACPDIRQLYHKQLCDGYSDTYVDYHPGQIGENHYDYQVVMNGIVQMTPDNPEFEWECVNYIHDDDGDVDLTLREQLDILTTWDFLKSKFKPGMEDPTDPRCNRL